MKKEINVSQLAMAVMWWLNYISAVGRNYVLSEGAIKFPISEYLERSTLNDNDIELEYGHPKLQQKRLDVFYKTPGKTAFELKYIKNGSTRDKDEKQRVFNDLMRLYLFLGRNNRSYFLICGSQKDFISDFQTLLFKPKNVKGSLFIKPVTKRTKPMKIIPEGFYTEWFSFDDANPDNIIDLKTTKQDFKDIYEKFKKEHQVPYEEKTSNKLRLPARIHTKLIFLSSNADLPANSFQSSKIGVWEILKTT